MAPEALAKLAVARRSRQPQRLPAELANTEGDNRSGCATEVRRPTVEPAMVAEALAKLAVAEAPVESAVVAGPSAKLADAEGDGQARSNWPAGGGRGGARPSSPSQKAEVKSATGIWAAA